MESKTKKSLPFVFVLAFSVCAFLILGWNFGFTSGFGLMGIWWNVWFVFSALLQICSILLLCLLIVISIWGWVWAQGKAQELKIGSWGMKAILECLFIVFAIVAVMVVIFASIPIGGITFGAILYLLVNIGSVVTYFVLRQKGIIEKKGVIEEIKSMSKEDRQESGKEDEKETVKKIKQDEQPPQEQDQEQPENKKVVKHVPKQKED